MIRLVNDAGCAVCEWPETPRGMQRALMRLNTASPSDRVVVGDATLHWSQRHPRPSLALAEATLRVALEE